VADPAGRRSQWFVSADGHLTDGRAARAPHRRPARWSTSSRDGEARATFVTDRFEPQDVLGRAVIVHAKPDNYGNIPASGYTPVGPAAVDLTARTGNAGDRVACGVVGG
jgi:Cu-Zn family superoxide dismutase